jgi:hypothetical protein
LHGPPVIRCSSSTDPIAYDVRFHIGFTSADKRDLVAFLSAL